MAFSHFNSFAFVQFGIPAPASVTYTYVGSGASNDDNIATMTYKNAAGTTIGVVALTYVGSTNNIASMTRTS